MFLKLTSADNREIFVNMNKVIYYDKGYENGKHTTNLHMERCTLYVTETPEYILEKTEELRLKKKDE